MIMMTMAISSALQVHYVVVKEARKTDTMNEIVPLLCEFQRKVLIADRPPFKIVKNSLFFVVKVKYKI